MSEPVSPLIQGKDAIEKSFLCAEKGIPNVIYGMPMAGATTPATFAGCLAIANSEILSQLVAIQLRNPGAPVIYGSMPSIMDMKTTIYSYGAPEAALMIGALTELCHYYRLPMFGTAGCTDSAGIDAQTGIEITYQVMTAALTGADIVHDVGFVYHAMAVSPELMVLTDEVIGMVMVLMGGIEINDETLPLKLIERLGPKSNYLSENHTLKYFRKFWVPKVFDRSFARTEKTKNSGDLLREKTLEILRTYQPKPLPEDLVIELKKMETSWYENLGLKPGYLKREQG
jgi:trimethylamine--corrinoid protein Co-methyltransferase